MTPITYTAAMYAETRNMTYYGGGDGGDGGIANKTQNFEVVAQYQFDFGLRPSIAYLQSKGKDLGGGIWIAVVTIVTPTKIWLNMLTLV